MQLRLNTYADNFKNAATYQSIYSHGVYVTLKNAVIENTAIGQMDL